MASSSQHESGGSGCSLLAEFLVPGIGLFVGEALLSIAKLCQEMKENETLCHRVYERLQLISEELAKITNTEMLHQNRVLFMYGDTIANFVKFLHKHLHKSLLKRLAGNRKVVQAIEEFHADIDELYKLLNIVHVLEMAKWRREWEEDRAKQQADLMAILSNTQTLHAELHSQHLEEGLAMLRFELDHKSDKNSFEQMALMKKTLHKIVRVSRTKVPHTPEWFIPSDDVEFDLNVAFGGGLYGSVHRGMWGRGTQVVIKCLLMDDDTGKQIFLKETAIWARLEHPHVLELFGACHVGTPAFFVCEDAVNGNFVDYLAKDKSEIWRLFFEAALGLDYLHSEKVMHDNLKCRNLLVGGDGKAKISDFGFSYFRSQAVGLNPHAHSNEIRWKAPECLLPTEEAPSDDLSLRLASDVFSFGMCIIEAFTGEQPHSTLDEGEVVDMAIAGEMHGRPEGLKDDEWAFVQRLCHPKAEERISLSAAIDELKLFADREEMTQRASSEDHVCPECGAETPVDFCFCGKCGFHFETNAGAA